MENEKIINVHMDQCHTLGDYLYISALWTDTTEKYHELIDALKKKSFGYEAERLNNILVNLQQEYNDFVSVDIARIQDCVELD